jgi:2-methylcitrate dehydratase PrpD
MTTESISAQLAGFVTALQYKDLPRQVQDHARMLVLDALGCGLVGSTTPEVGMLRRAVQAMSGDCGESLLWGTSAKGPLPLAVMANSAAVHMREIDDFSLAYHAGSVVVPAAIGVAAAMGASGAELLTAVAAGYEVSFRIAQGGAEPGQPGFLPFKKKGWHSTSLFGPFGAAVAVAKLLGLDTERMIWSIGLAGSTASGTWAFNAESSTNKRVHPGLASKSGIVAAYLAREGITGPARLFEAEWGGFYGTYLQGERWYPQHVTDGLGSDWQILHAGFKFHASCRRMHSSLDAFFAVVKKHHFQAEQIGRITVRGNHLHKRQLSRFPVNSLLEAQFSLPYAIAAALVSGSSGLDQFTEAAIRRAEIAPLAERICIEIDEALPETGEPTLVFELTDGRVLRETVPVPTGHPSNPLSEEDLTNKFKGNAGLALPAENVEALQAQLLYLENVSSLQTIIRLLTPPARA